jgi:hypothetical protein
MNTINLMELGQQNVGESRLDLIRLNNDELALIPFTTDVVPVTVHYCPDDEIHGYVRCNGADCVLCRVGRKPDERYLFPVYVPAIRSVGVLPVSRSMQPHALLPQLLDVIQNSGHPAPIVLFIRREGMAKFFVTSGPLQDGVDSGDAKIKIFLERMREGSIDLQSVFNRLSNKQLAAVASISDSLRLKGIDPDAID